MTDISDTDISDTDISDTDISDTDISDTDIGDTEISDTDISGTAISDTDISDTDISDTDISDTALLVYSSGQLLFDLDVVEEFLDMARLSSTTTRHDICEYMIRVVEKLELSPAKLCGLSTDGALFMTGRTNGFPKTIELMY